MQHFLFQLGSRLVKVQSVAPAGGAVQTLTCAKKQNKRQLQGHYVEGSSGTALRFPRPCVHHYSNAEVCQECWLLDNRASFFFFFCFFFFFLFPAASTPRRPAKPFQSARSQLETRLTFLAMRFKERLLWKKSHLGDGFLTTTCISGPPGAKQRLNCCCVVGERATTRHSKSALAADLLGCKHAEGLA